MSVDLVEVGFGLFITALGTALVSGVVYLTDTVGLPEREAAGTVQVNFASEDKDGNIYVKVPEGIGILEAHNSAKTWDGDGKPVIAIYTVRRLSHVVSIDTIKAQPHDY